MKRHGGSFAKDLAYAMEAPQDYSRLEACLSNDFADRLADAIRNADDDNLKALFDSDVLYFGTFEKYLDGGIFDNE